MTGDFNRFLSLVIVDYGTGIRVAAPTAVLSSMTQAARNGIKIKSGAHMEKLCAVDTVVFDKTGTLSHGEPAAHEEVGYLDYVTPNPLVGLAAAAETKLKHPVAEALRIKARDIRANVPHCEETRFDLGLGVAGLNTLALGLAVPGGLVSPVTTALISNGSAVLAGVNGLRPLISLR